MSWQEKNLEKQFTLTNKLKLINDKNGINIFEIYTTKSDKITPRTIRITTTKDLMGIISKKPSDKKYIFSFYIERRQKDRWDDSNLWEIDDNNHNITIKTRSIKKDPVKTHLQDKTATKTTPKKDKYVELTPKLEKDFVSEEKTSKTSPHIKNPIKDLSYIEKNIKSHIDCLFQTIIGAKTTAASEITSLSQYCVPISQGESDNEKESWQEKITTLEKQMQQQKHMFEAEILKLEEKIKTQTIGIDFQNEKINQCIQRLNNSSFGTQQHNLRSVHARGSVNKSFLPHKPRQKRDWQQKGFQRISAYCSSNNINLIKTYEIDGKLVRHYEIKFTKQKSKKTLFLETNHQFTSTCQINFFVKKEMTELDSWNINDIDNGVTFFIF